MIVIYRKSDLFIAGSVAGITLEQEIELNVIPNFGGFSEDYDYIETDETGFRLEDINGVVQVIKNLIDPPITNEPIDEEKAAMAEAIIDMETRLSELEVRLNA